MVDRTLAALLVTLAAGCGGTSDGTPVGDTADTAAPADTTPVVTAPYEEGSVRFSLAAVDEDDLFAFPYPSDARVNARGAPDLSDFPTSQAVNELLEHALGAVQAGPAGFSPLGSVYFGFHEAIDPASLPQDPNASLGPDASVYIVDVSPGSPTSGQRFPLRVTYRADAGGYWPARTLVASPLYEVPLPAGRQYAVVVTTRVLGPDGKVLTPPDAIARLPAVVATAAPMPDEMRALLPIYAAIDDDSRWAEVLAATVFTTADPMAELRALAPWIRATLPSPVAKGIAHKSRANRYDLYEGTFASEEFLAGDPPFMAFGEGLIAVDADGGAVTRTPTDLRFALSVPRGEMPAEGWPIVVYSHGLGEDYRGFVRVAAGPMGARGVAVLGLDPPLQGARNPSGIDDRQYIINLTVNNLIGGREILRQGVLDNVQAVRLIAGGGLSIGADVAMDGAAIHFDAERIAFLGHSEGAQIGALFLPLEPGIGAGALSEGGGGGAITLVELNLDGVNVSGLVAYALGVDEEVEALELGHPLISMVIQPLMDPADPLHIAREIFAEPLGDPHDFVMIEGFNDALTPPPSMEALASAARLPIAEPVSREIAGLTLQGVGSVALPAKDNLGPTDGQRATGALIQLPDADHYSIYFDDAVRNVLFDFLASSLDDNTTLRPVPPSSP